MIRGMINTGGASSPGSLIAGTVGVLMPVAECSAGGGGQKIKRTGSL